MIEVKKMQSLYGRLQVNGDKSLTIRAILLGAISKGETKIENALISQDTLATVACAKTMGAKVLVNGSKICITGAEKIANNCIFYCENSATLARLLIGILAGANVRATVTGDSSLIKRPMERVCSPLNARGAKTFSTNGCLPVEIYPATLCDFEYDMQTDSAQVKSAILLSGAISGVKTVVNEKNPTRDHTEKMLPLFGGKVKVTDKKIIFEKSSLRGANITVPADPSSGAFYIALGLLLGEITVDNLLIAPLRAGFYTKLQSAGANIKYTNVKNTPFGKVATVTAYKSKINRFTVIKEEIPSLIDELPILAVCSAFNGGCEIIGAEELKYKESNRFLQTLNLIEKAGGSGLAKNDNLIINATFNNAKKFDYKSDDHRMVLSAYCLMTALLGGNLGGESFADISFPDFYKNLNALPMALIGKDLSKSKSGIIHKFILTALGVKNFTYELCSFADLNVAEFLKKCPYKAINATIPYKKELFYSVFECDKRAKEAKSVNYALDKKGYTTDGEGLIYALDYYNIEYKNKSVLVLGAGGAGRSIALALKNAGATVYLKNRTMEKAKEFCENTGGKILLYGNQRCDILINATAVNSENLFSANEIKNACAVININYCESEELKEKCFNLKTPYFNGGAMLFFQAYLSDVLLLGKRKNKKRAISLYKNFLVEYEDRSN